jgi:hypothetical protein
MVARAPHRGAGRGRGAARCPLAERGRLCRHHPPPGRRSQRGRPPVGRQRRRAGSRAAPAGLDVQHRAGRRTQGRTRAERRTLQSAGGQCRHNGRTHPGDVGGAGDQQWTPRIRAANRGADYAAAREAARRGCRDLPAGDVRDRAAIASGRRRIRPPGSCGNVAEPAGGLRRDCDTGRDGLWATRLLHGAADSVRTRRRKQRLPRRVRACGLAQLVAG